MRIEEYEIKHLCNDLKQVMRDIGQSSAVAISGLLAERLYEMGWRQQDKMAAGNERGYNLGLVDGAKQLAEKIKKLLYDDYIILTLNGNVDEQRVFENIDQLLEEMKK